MEGDVSRSREEEPSRRVADGGFDVVLGWLAPIRDVAVYCSDAVVNYFRLLVRAPLEVGDFFLDCRLLDFLEATAEALLFAAAFLGVA